ncbi:hypothetical protein [Massilia glaciei]|uniref:Uncharacterized protein n=1 Tax=Massilia glaciei TaxID=1524097 RepID=A0A2U2HMS4_9BURK|nr:hypothetical protein [Massilia glaciei]PWF48824.1 hypothetical protein C7C56_009820 [Massilia glaciei]
MGTINQTKLAHAPEDTAGAAPDARLRVALERRAANAAGIAIARWSSGNTYTEMQIAAALRPSARARWYDTAQKNLQDWLQRGGFAQRDGEQD